MDSFEGILTHPTSFQKFSYCENNPMNVFDPSGMSPILDLTITTGTRAAIAAFAMGSVNAAYTYAKTRSLKIAVESGAKTAALTGFAYISPAFAVSMLASLPAQLGLAIYNGDLKAKDTPEMATYIVTAVALNVLFKTQAVPPNPAVVSGILRDAVRVGTGNAGVGSATPSEALLAGKAWIGENFRVASDSKCWISADGLRQFRIPTFKPNQNKWQANLEERTTPSGRWQANAHIDIVGATPPSTALQNAATASAAINEIDDE